MLHWWKELRFFSALECGMSGTNSWPTESINFSWNNLGQQWDAVPGKITPTYKSWFFYNPKFKLTHLQLEADDKTD